MKELQYPFDAAYLIKKKKSLRKMLLADGSARFPKRIAVLGGSTTSDIVKMLELFLLDQGIEPSFYECEYAQFEQEALFPGEELTSFAPELIVIHTSNRNLRYLPSLSDTKEAVEEKKAAEISRFTAIWDSLTAKFGCPIVQNNFEMPFYRILGNLDCADMRGRGRFITQINEAFYSAAEKRSNLYIHDLAYQAADYGLREWANPYYWNMYKYCMCFEAIPYFAFSLANVIKSIFGRNKKVLALDLDNTLWGGVVGDDGVDGIEIGQETGVSQSYYEFQQYAKELRSSGILLAVCSKNDEENALDGLRHPEGALRPEDFADIKANWENKDRNILQIAKDLNLGVDSIVFADDNPVERAIVREQVPVCAVPEMDGVEHYIMTIDRGGYFEVTSLSEDDMKRNEMYAENAKRAAAQASYADYGEFLTSLAMKGEIDAFTPVYLARITQLTNKSNQFNVTTRRYSQPEIESIAADPDYITLYGKLIDKFGDNGVVSVVIGHKNGAVLDVDLWLMSCRVLKRDMEFAMLDTLVDRCREAGIGEIRGYYYPTKKNGMVRELFGTFGFEKISEDMEGNTVWSMKTEGYQKQNRYIEL